MRPERCSLTTAAQNILVFLRKSPLHKNHFFEWWKTENFSTACGTVTLKSPPPRAFSVPDVHQRLQKCLSRCTLDCGFKTSESPALRGFVAERAPIRGTSLYLVLKSNGQTPADSPPEQGARIFAQAPHVRRKLSSGVLSRRLPLKSHTAAHRGKQRGPGEDSVPAAPPVPAVSDRKPANCGCPPGRVDAV